MYIKEDCQSCTDSIVYGLTKTSKFRTRKAKEYPQDSRNAAAAATLKQLAKNAAELSTDFWELLQLHYIPDSREWQNAVSQATKDVGFANQSKSYAFSFSGQFASCRNRRASPRNGCLICERKRTGETEKFAW